MNNFKLLTALFAGASLVSAAANPRADANGVCYFNAADSQRLVHIVQEGDNPAPLAEMLEGCQGLVFNQYLEDGLRDMIRLRRHAIFHSLLPRIVPGGGWIQYDLLPYSILAGALGCNNFAIADEMLARGALDVRRVGQPLWIAAEPGVWNLEALRAYIDRHQTRLATLSPSHGDMFEVRTEADARVLIALAQHCQAIAGPQVNIFNPTMFLGALLADNHFLTEEELARLALLLHHEGAELNEMIRQAFAEHPQAYQMFNYWTGEEVKEPGCA